MPSRAEVFLGYLDYFRSRLVSKLEALPGGELRRSRLPSGWTPIELLKHVAHDERPASTIRNSPDVSAAPPSRRRTRLNIRVSLTDGQITGRLSFGDY